MSHYSVSANGRVFGVYPANTEQEAKDACARDAGYLSESHMVWVTGQASQLEAFPALPWFKLEGGTK